MSESQEYEYYKATVRKPKGEPLAKSGADEGWNLGFTPKTSEKNPKYIDIRLDEKIEEPQDASEPWAGTEDTDHDAEVYELLGAVVVLAIIVAANTAAPHVGQWWRDKALPFFRRRWEALQRWTRRSQSGADAAREDSGTTLEVIDPDELHQARQALTTYETDMSSAEARQHLAELLIAQRFVQEKQHLLANVRITPADDTSKLEAIVQALTAKEVEAALVSRLAAQPTLLNELRHLLKSTSKDELLRPNNASIGTLLELTSTPYDAGTDE